MKTKIAVILILIYEVFAAGFVSRGISPHDTYIKIDPIPTYAPELLLIASLLLLIDACILWTKTIKTVYFSGIAFAFINLGIICWGIIYYLGGRCDGPNQITPDSGAATVSIIAAAIITLALLLLLSDIKRISRITTAENTAKPQGKSLLLAIIASMFIYFIIIIISGAFASAKTAPYNAVRDDIQNAVTAYMTDHPSSNWPIISDNAIFTLTNSSDSYYIINMSALLTVNGGMLREVPDGVIQLPGPNNDNCDGGAIGCSNNSHYIWGVNSLGYIASKLEYPPNRNLCQKNACGSCDGYQGVWP